MKLIRTKEALGHVICHDITQIIRGVKKGVVFRKGHVVKAEDIPVLLSVGKEHLYVWEKQEGMLHEDEAAEILRDVCLNDHMKASGPTEGKIELTAEKDGLFLLDLEKLNEINRLGEVMIAARHHNFSVKRGDKLLGTRVIPLVIDKEKMDQVKAIAGNDKIAEIRPFRIRTAGVITTGSEVFCGRIQDTFTPVIEEKLAAYGVAVMQHAVVDDKKADIIRAILEMKKAGVELILCTGGMSVDPDDLTPAAVRDAGAEIVSYGAPVLPGAMFLLGYFADGVPVMGLPGCVMYAKATIFDIILPRVLAGRQVTGEEIALLGNGGLCLSCEVCTFPNCGFGK